MGMSPIILPPARVSHCLIWLSFSLRLRLPLRLALQEKSVREGAPTTFFDDEFRSPVYVDDIVHIVRHLMMTTGTTAASVGTQPDPPIPPAGLTFNMGGPERLSRVNMAMKVWKLCSSGAAQSSVQAAACLTKTFVILPLLFV